MPFSIFKSFTIGTFLLALSSPSAAFSPSSSLQVHARRLNSIPNTNLKLAYRTISESEIDLNGCIASEPLSTTKPITSPNKVDADGFDWFKAWHPVFPVDILDKEKPTPLELLGMKLVVYNDGAVVDEEGNPTGFSSKLARPKDARRVEGTWRAFADACPHRKASLSEGRVEDDGSLLCSYHGWRWNGDGNLTAVPAASKSELQRIIDNPKSCCNAFPTKVKGGLLYVWPSSGSDARIESELTPLPEAFDPEALGVDEERIVNSPYVYRRAPVSWDFFLENAMDPAHVQHAHHGTIGNRYEESVPFDTVVTKKASKNGFEMSIRFPGAPAYTDKFEAPGVFSINTPLADDGAAYVIQAFVTPSSPGWSNVITRQTVVKTKDGTVPPTGNKRRDGQMNGILKLKMLPDFFNNFAVHRFFNEDMIHIHSQEHHMASSDEYSLAKSEEEKADRYVDAILPTSCDKPVIVFRKWIKDFSKGRIPYKGDLTLHNVDRTVVFDVYHQSTVYSTKCMNALKNAKNARSFALGAIAVIFFLKPAAFLGTLGSGALIGLFGGVTVLAHKIIELLTYMEHVPAEDD